MTRYSQIWIGSALLLMACGGDGAAVEPRTLDSGVADTASTGDAQDAAWEAADESCRSGERVCDRNVPIVCVSGRKLRGAPCPFLCSAGQCAGECVEGSKQCVNGAAVLCEGGMWGAPVPCSGLCSDGACTDACTPGLRQCSGGGVEVCSDARVWVPVEACASVCRSGQCLGDCVAGTVDCASDGKTPRRCSADGFNQTGDVCPGVCTGGACVDSCVEGEKQCSGGTQLQCTGGSWKVGEVCAAACVSGACTGTCRPGSRKCDGNSALLCSSSGSWSTSLSCATGCVDGACLASPIRDAGSDAPSSDAGLEGGALGATMTLSGDPVVNFGALVVGQTLERTLTAQNVGSGPAVLGAVTTNALALTAPFALSGGTCSSSQRLAPGESCTLTVVAAPVTVSSFAGKLELSFSGGSEPKVARALAVSGIAGTGLTLSGDPIVDFGTVRAGQSASRTLMLSNGSTSALTLGTLTTPLVGLGAPFELVGGSCVSGQVLAPSGSCTLTVRFAPTQTGLVSDSLEVAYSGASSGTALRTLLGIGGSGAILAFDQGDVVDVGPVLVGETKRQLVTVRNRGDHDATLGEVSDAGLALSAPFAHSGGSCTTGYVVAPGGSCTLQIDAAPGAPGVLSSTLALAYEGGMASAVSATLQGQANPAAVLTFSPGTLGFGQVRLSTTNTQTLTVTNVSSVSTTLGTISNAALGLTSPFVLASGGTCTTGMALAPSGTCTLSVSVLPSSLGNFSATLALPYSGGLSPTATCGLSARGVGVAALSISDGPTYDFGSVMVLKTATKSLTVTNTGTTTTTLGALPANTLLYPFAVAGGTCSPGALLSPGQACTVAVEVRPNPSIALGTHWTEMQVGYSDGDTQVATIGLATTLFDMQVEAAYAYTCALRTDKGVKCWGSGGPWLGYGDSSSRGTSPTHMGNNLPYVIVSSELPREILLGKFGANVSCMRHASGRLKCWGDNTNGKLGQGDLASRGGGFGQMGDALPFIELSGSQQVTQVAPGTTMCALLTSGAAKCWADPTAAGHEDMTVRGDNSGEMGDSLAALQLGQGRSIRWIATGYTQSCAVLDNNQVKCWGLADQGQLGLGDTVDRGTTSSTMGDALPAIDLGTTDAVTQVVAGYARTCALFSTGKVKCWGANTLGMLGLEDTFDRGTSTSTMGALLPYVDLGAGKRAVALAAGTNHTCALLDSGAVKCWGNAFGAVGVLGLGDQVNRGGSVGTMGDSLPEVNLGSGRTALRISAGYRHTCALLDNLRIKCWGQNSQGELGLGDTTARGASPAHMGEGLPYVDIGF